MTLGHGQDEALKACCVALYELPWVELLLGSLHPGGEEATQRLARVMDLPPGARVLDVGSGPGRSGAGPLASFGWRVTALDRSPVSARRAAVRGLRATVADGEELPFVERSFDGVVSECTLCLFPRPERALAEIRRVLVRGGRLGLMEPTLEGPAPAGLEGPEAFAWCLAGARDEAGLRDLLGRAGLPVRLVEDHSSALRALLSGLEGRLSQLGLLQAELGGGRSVGDLLAMAGELVHDGRLRYVLYLAERPESVWAS